MVQEVRVDESGDVIAELRGIEQRWMRQEYIDFAGRMKMLRYALVGAAVERAANRVPGPLSDTLKNYIATVDQEFAE